MDLNSPKAPPFAVYLIHYEVPYRGKSHYVGSTETPLLMKRLHRHARGHGSHFTKHAGSVNERLLLAKVWFGNDRRLEADIKRAGRYPAQCPICLRATAAAALAAVPINYTADDLKASQQLHQATTWPQAETAPTARKGR